MSILKKNVLAFALVAALGTTSAFAVTISTNGDQNPVRVATADVLTNTTAIGVNQNVPLSIETGDFILGRTTGFAIRVSLESGGTNAARFFADPTFTTPDLPAGWTVTLAAGGAGSNFAVYSVNPPSTNPVPGIVDGVIFQITNADNVVAPTSGLRLNNLVAAGLNNDNQTVTLRTFIIDPVTAQPILNTLGWATPVLRSGNPVVLSCTVGTGTGPTDSRLTPAERIDVGTVGTANGQGTRQGFSDNGSIGSLTNAGTRNFGFHAGFVTHNADASFPGFVFQATDTFRTIVTLTDRASLGAFATSGNIFLAADNTCAAPIAGLATTTTGSFNGATLGANQVGFQYQGATGASVNLALCFSVPTNNTTQIDPTAITTQTNFQRTGATAFSNLSAVCNVAPMLLNGSTVNIANLPPAGNATQEGFIRIVNNSTTSGRVTIRGKDDAGANGTNSITLDMPAGRSVVYTSAELESGTVAAATPAKPALTGVLGDGAGRWRLNIVGEFDNMQVQAYARNVNNDALSNITDFESNQEQATDRKNLNFD